MHCIAVWNSRQLPRRPQSRYMPRKTEARCRYHALMRISLYRVVAAVVLSIAGATATAQDRTAPAVRIYDATELALHRYTVIKRLWAGTWRASFWVPSHDDLPAALKALTDKAADLKADGVTNIHCISEAGGKRGFFCYGLAIKLK